MNATASFAGQSVLVTGGSGFIGRLLVARLIAGGARVSLLQRNSLPHDPACKTLIADFSAPDAASQIDTALAGRRFDAVFNLAAYGVTRSADSSASCLEHARMLASRVNVEAALTLARHALMAGSSVFVQAGTCSEYAPPQSNVFTVETDATEQRQNDNRFIYGVSKNAASKALLSMVKGTTLSFAVARIFNVYGPGEAARRLFPSLVDGLAKRQRVSLSSGKQVKDYLHIEDVTEGLCAIAVAATNQRFQGVVNLSSGEAVSVAQFARTVARVMDRKEELLGFGDRSTHPDEVGFLVGSTVLRNRLTGWQPRYTLDTGLQNAVHQMILLNFN